MLPERGEHRRAQVTQQSWLLGRISTYPLTGAFTCVALPLALFLLWLLPPRSPRRGAGWPGHGPAPLRTSPRSLDDDRLAEPGTRLERRATRENHTVLHGAEWRDEGRRRAPPGDPATDAGRGRGRGRGRIHAGAGAHSRTARALRQRACRDARVSG